VLAMTADSPSDPGPARAEAATPGLVRLWRRLRRQPLGLVGLGLTLLFVVVAAFAPWLAPHSPYYQFPNGLLANGAPVGPSREFPLGTDDLGRDLLSRLIWGTRNTLTIALLANLVATAIGTAFGGLAGYFGGWVDAVLMRFTEVLLAVPAVLLAAFLAMVTRPAPWSLILIIGAVNWFYLARIVRAEVLAVKTMEYVQAAKAAGASHTRTLWRHVLAQVWGTVVVYMTLEFSTTTMFTASLSFVGIGIQPPTPDWGNIIAEGSQYLTSAPRLMIVPGIALGLSVLGFNLLGDALRDATERQ
jgi:peptide/nickel transport system permease protein